MDLAQLIAPPITDESATCPSPEALLRYREGYAEGREQESMAAHVAGCSRCQADLDSLDIFNQEVAQAYADAQALADFQPSPEHARRCFSLREEDLAALSSPETNISQETLDHLDACVYCSCRAVLLAAAPPAGGRPPLRLHLLAGMLEPGLRRAEQVVLWGGARAGTLVQRLGARLSEAGQLLASGLEGMIRLLRPAFGATMGEGGANEARWEIPLVGREEILVVTIAPGMPPGEWDVSCRLEGPGAGELTRSARLELREGANLHLTGNLADVMAQPARLATGEWLLTLTMEEGKWHIPVSLG